MATITINNGTGNKNIVPGNYTASARIAGYNNLSISPTSITVSSTTETFPFTIAATGSATITLTDVDDATAIENATFMRCNSTGTTTYGTPVLTNPSGVATFNNLPFGTDAPTVYIIETDSDGTHIAPTTVLQLNLADATGTNLAVTNEKAAEQNFKLTDANYTDLPIDAGFIDLN